MAISAQRGKTPSNVNSLTSPQRQPTPSTSRCPLLPVSLSGPWQTLWSGLLSAARMFVCSLSHLVAWHAAQCASSPSVYPAWRREIKQKKLPWRLQSEERQSSLEESECPSPRRGEETVRVLNVTHTKKVGFSYVTDIPGVPVNCLKALTHWLTAKLNSFLL